MRFHDVHIHLFNISHVPIKTFMKRYGIGLSAFMRKIPFTTLDDRARAFASISEKDIYDLVMMFSREMEALCDKLEKANLFFVDKITVCPLIINFARESVNKRLSDQVFDLQEEINFYDAHHNGRIEFIKFVDESTVATYDRGLKVYPPMGIDVEEPGHMPTFAMAQNHHIPITSHCSDGGFFSAKKTRCHLRELSHPKKWRNILDTFPNLKINFAHLGGLNPEWVKEIKYLVDKYPNVYTDVSSVLSNSDKCKRYVDKLPKDRILFGSDWYMSTLDEISYVDLCFNFLHQFSQEDVQKFVCDNPRRFLHVPV